MYGDAPDQSGASGRGYCIERLGAASLFGPVPMSPGASTAQRWTGADSATWACFAMVLVMVSLPAPARGQPEAGASREIPVHPDITTVLSLPDTIELARFTGQETGMMQATKRENLLHIQPRAGLRAGTEVALFVQTATVRRRFRLRVVGRARDAWRHVMVLAPDAEPAPATSVSPGTPAPASPEPLSDSEPTGKPDESKTSQAPVLLRSPRPEISVHFVGSLGFTGLDVRGSQPFRTRQLQAGLGARLMVTRPGAWWAFEGNILGEWPGGPMSFRDDNSIRTRIEVDGPWLRVESGIRAQLGGTKWISSLYAGLGAQAHLRRTEPLYDGLASSETMPHGPVLALGIGLQRRAGRILMGLDFQVRQGWPDGYYSMTAFWTVGSFLDAD
jgi:hypothetical protein